MTVCNQVVGYRPFGINLDTHMHGANYSYYCRPFNLRQLGCLERSNTDWQVTRRRKARNRSSEIEDYIVGNKKFKMQDIAVFCYYSCSVATDMFGLYCSVNR